MRMKECMKIENGHATVAFPPAPAHEQADFGPKPEGLKLLFAASQIETNPGDKDAEANGAEAQAADASSITDVSVSNGVVAGTADFESRSGREVPRAETGSEAAAYSSENDSETENPAIAAIDKQDRSFPLVLHEILATTECQSILHWLPDGFSFIIADKQRFCSEILPEYFREALLNSFIRKLNRWGFRRVKSRSKAEESSFAHKNFVRGKPWQCLEMRCKSKPTYHKVPSAKKAKKNMKKKEAKQKSTAAAATVGASNKSFVTPAGATSGMVNRVFASTFSRMAVSEHELLSLPNPNLSNLKAPAPAAPARLLSTADASTIRENQNQYLAYHQQRISHERQILVAQMLRQHQLQLEMQRLNQMLSQIGERPASSRNVQRATLAQYVRDVLNNRNNHHRGERK